MDDDRSLDQQIMDQSPPLNRLASRSPSNTNTEQPNSSTQRSYLFALLTCPNMDAYLTNHDLPEDIYCLPLPLSTLLSEAKEEVIATNQGANYSALDQLKALREFVWEASAHDISNMVPVLDDLTKNDDQLDKILNRKRTGV